MIKKYYAVMIFLFFTLIIYPDSQAGGGYEKILKLLENEKYKDSNDKPADPIWAVLWKYSPDSYHLAKRTEDYLYGDMTIGNIRFPGAKIISRRITHNQDGSETEKILPGYGLKRWLDRGKTFIDQVKYLDDAVHEENHKFTNNNALYLFSIIPADSSIFFESSEKGNSSIINLDSYFLDRDRTIYAPRRKCDNPGANAFPASKLEKFIPEDKRTFRYKTYIVHSQHQSTQTSGISGLLDEYNSYYISNKIVYDLYDFYRIEQSQIPQTWMIWTERFFAYYFSWAEFRYWILSYMIYARDNEPRIYKSIMKDDMLREAFTIIDDRFTDLIFKMFSRLGKELPAHLKNFNISVKLDVFNYRESGKFYKGYIYRIGELGQMMPMKDFQPLCSELERKEYVDMADTFRKSPQKSQPTIETLKTMMMFK